MNGKNLLIAVDASENSRRAVAYVGEMVGDRPGFTIALLYIERFPERDLFASEGEWKERCRKQKVDIMEFLDEATRLLTEKGVPSEAVTVRYIVSCRSPFTDTAPGQCWMGPSIAEKILDVLKEGHFGTVVIGRRGISRAEEFLFGSVSSKVVQYAKNCSVWVVA